MVILLAPPVNYHHAYKSKPICLQASKVQRKLKSRPRLC